MSQLTLDLRAARHDALCRVLPITPPVKGPDGSLTATWKRARRRAWAVTPVPEGCLAWQGGARWFYAAENSAPMCGVGSSVSSGPGRGDRDAVALYAQLLLLRMELHYRRYLVISRLMDLELRERNARVGGIGTEYFAARCRT